MKNLRNKVRKERPDVFFLQERKFSLYNIQAIRSKIWMGSRGIVTGARGMASGIVILWHHDSLHLNNFWENHFYISAEFQFCDSEVRETLTNVYGWRIITQKPSLMSLLEKEAQEMENRLWIMIDNFNLITSLKEKKGGRIS